MTRLKYRIPVRIRHYWKLLATCAAVLLAFAVVFSTVRVAPLVTSSSDSGGEQVTQDIAGSKDLFDATVAHSIKLTFRDDAYQRLLDSFWSDGEKEFLEADLTLDGTAIASVGIRLKGNSTLSGLTRNGEARANGFPGGRREGGGQNGGGRPGGGGFGGRSSLKAEEPETLPWLIRFDEFVDGRRYQGHREIAVRVAGMGGGSTVLTEAVSLNVLAAAGETAQRYAYSSFTVNGRPTTARLIVEHPDENFADEIGGNGVLYKSLASSQFTDQGDDQTDYADDFKQINKKGSQDLQPVIDLVRWVNKASDAEFAQKLGNYVDVKAFARYVATQNLLLNGDDMAGPGKNYYLWYDLETKKFTVLGWDYNLTLSGSADQNPNESVSMFGGGGFPGGGNQAGGMQLPEGFQLPEGMEPPAGVPGPDQQGQGPGGGGFGGLGGNKLKERFLAGDAFKSVYQDAYRELFQKIYGNGTAANSLESIVKVLASVDGYDKESTATDAGKLRTLIRERTTYLVGTDVIKG